MVMSILDFLFLQHPLVSVVMIGAIVFMTMVKGSYDFVVFLLLFGIAIYHDALGSKKK